jgi:hypothetical protein
MREDSVIEEWMRASSRTSEASVGTYSARLVTGIGAVGVIDQEVVH